MARDYRNIPTDDTAAKFADLVAHPDLRGLPILFSVGPDGCRRRVAEVKRKRTRSGSEYVLVVLER